MADKNNSFGGFWTERKIDIFIKYLKAYLQIMNKTKFNLVYFDGFAGSGYIERKGKPLIEGVALKVLSLTEPKEFDIYYLVELDKGKSKILKDLLNKKFPEKESKTFVIPVDCNAKLVDLSNFLKRNKYYRAIVFIDPKGMQLKWESIKVFKDLGVDLWILLPIGIGVNRLLSIDGSKISNSLMQKLSDFLDLSKDEIMEYFYKKESELTLFGENTILKKKEDAIDITVELIRSKLNEIFKLVSVPFPMKTSKNSLLYHFIFASNNPAGVKIANEIIGKELRDSL